MLSLLLCALTACSGDAFVTASSEGGNDDATSDGTTGDQDSRDVVSDGTSPDGSGNDVGPEGSSGDGGGSDVASDGNGGADAGNGDAGKCVKATPTGSSCDLGACYCGNLSATCYAVGVAATCCGQSVACVTDGGGSPDAAGCTFKHPLLDAGARYCGPGECYCKWSTGESCYSLDTVMTCCSSASFTCY